MLAKRPKFDSGFREDFLPLTVAFDIGGTFTDMVSFDEATGGLVFCKAPTTYDDFSKGIFDCVAKAGTELSQASFVKHGTTLVINALLQRIGCRAALVTTKGFRDVLEIGRGNRTRPFDLRFRRHAPLIDRNLRFELDERIGSAGEVLVPLDEASVDRLADELVSRGVEAVAISFVNAYLNPLHERKVADLMRDRLPGVFIATGTGLSREWYEFERSATAAASAFVGPAVDRYLEHFERKLTQTGFGGSLMLMGSHGGVLSPHRAREKPISLVESGPVGGVIGAAGYARALGIANLIAFDIGGTTAKCALVRDASFEVESTYYVGGYEAGFPIREDVLDIIEVGTGGGSIAAVDDQGRLSVGPRSAGSTPGPACYGRGGVDPTITDANLALGRISSDRFLGGEMHIDLESAQAALRERVGKPLGYCDEDAATAAARGVLTLANLQMAEAIKKISISRGLDPRGFALFTFGGGGPLHASDLAHALGIPKVIVPPSPGTFSALGMLMANARLNASRTFLAEVDDSSFTQLSVLFEETNADLLQTLTEDFGGMPVVFERWLEMRYFGQMHSLKIFMPEQSSRQEVESSFHEFYRKKYGHSNETGKLQFVAIQSIATLDISSVRISETPAEPSVGPARATREVFFLEDATWRITTVFFRDDLPVGFSERGPALIEGYDSNILIGPRDRFTVGRLGEIEIDCAI